MYSVVMMVFIFLVIRVLFKKFGYISEEEAKKKEEAIKMFLNLQKNCSCKNDGCKSIKLARGTEKNICSITEQNKEELLKTKTKKEEENNFFDDNVFLKSTEKIIIDFIGLFSEKKILDLAEYCEVELYKNLEEKIQDLVKEEKNLKITIISFKEKEIIEKNINDDKGKIIVKITTEQINYVEDKDNKLISGYKNKIQTITEYWEFLSNDIKNNMWSINSIKNSIN